MARPKKAKCKKDFTEQTTNERRIMKNSNKINKAVAEVLALGAWQVGEDFKNVREIAQENDPDVFQQMAGEAGLVVADFSDEEFEAVREKVAA